MNVLPSRTLWLPVLSALLLLPGCMSMELADNGFPVNFAEVEGASCRNECKNGGLDEMDCDIYCDCYTDDIQDTMTYEEYQRKSLWFSREWEEERSRIYKDCRVYLPESVFCRTGDVICEMGGPDKFYSN